MNQLIQKIFNSITIASITEDSRKVKANTLFIALKGEVINGVDYIEAAIRQGASVVITETDLAKEHYQGIPIFFMPDIRQQLVFILAHFYQLKLENLKFVGVTGTNGKTSVAHMLAQVFAGGYVGTLGLGTLGSLNKTDNTTPNLMVLMPLFKQLQQQSIDYCALEVSSHALIQKRTSGLPFKTAVFTNLSHEHLDYHGTMDAYAEAKYSLFLEPAIANAVICIDDKWGRALVKKLSSQTKYLSYGFSEQADIYPLSYKESLEGLCCLFNTPAGRFECDIAMIGTFNISNIMAVIGVLLVEGWQLANIAHAIAQLDSICGRMELIKQQPTFVVDYAHTPDALAKALSTLKQLSRGNLWCVFGCGGDRDRSKRAEMGRVAQHYADKLVITNDNPRTEDPLAIVADIQAGLTNSGVAQVILDRAKAIRYCFEHSNSNDVVLVAGKGHEDYQIIGDRREYFSDQSIIKEYPII